MLSNWIVTRIARQLIGTLALGAALVCGWTPAFAAEKRSSLEDRERFVSITRRLENAPLNAEYKTDRAWAVEWLTEAPDITVTVCDDPLGGLVQSDYVHGPEILAQYMFSMAARIIEHPETQNDPISQQLAGVEGALNAYHSILRDKPEAKSSALEGVLEAKNRGELASFVRRAFASCMTKN